MIKKSDKNWPPLKKAKMSLKWPKSPLCVFRAAWSGVFSIPGGTTGPGFKAEIRPPLFFTFFRVFKLAFSCFNTFSFCWFCHFLCFCEFHILIKFMFWGHFGLRPYYITKGRTDVCVVVSPLTWCYICFGCFVFSFRVGEFTQERRYNFILSFSPLWTGFFFVVGFFCKLSGRFTG